MVKRTVRWLALLAWLCVGAGAVGGLISDTSRAAALRHYGLLGPVLSLVIALICATGAWCAWRRNTEAEGLCLATLGGELLVYGGFAIHDAFAGMATWQGVLTINGFGFLCLAVGARVYTVFDELGKFKNHARELR